MSIMAAADREELLELRERHEALEQELLSLRGDHQKLEMLG